MTGDGELLALVVGIAVAAAVQLELGPDLVQRPAVPGRDGASRNVNADLDAARLAACPVADPELVAERIGQDVGEVEIRPLPDCREAQVEAPVAAYALPQPPLELDSEA